MPVEDYYSGHGAEVLKAMKDTYKSVTKAKRVFYAKANKDGLGPKKKEPKKSAPRKTA